MPLKAKPSLPIGAAIRALRQERASSQDRDGLKGRNRVIRRVFHELGLIEQWGSGIQRMTAARRQAGLPEPSLEEMGIHFRVTLAATRVGRPELDEIDEAILAAVETADGLSISEAARHIRLSVRATRTRVVSLVGRGLIVEIATGPHDPRRRYFRVEGPPE